MAEQVLKKMRIQLRRGTTAEWETYKDVVPTAGEPCFDLELNTLKIGDGIHKYSELDFVYAKAADVVAACKSESALTTFVNNVISNAGIATNEALTTLAGRVTTAEGEIDVLLNQKLDSPTNAGTAGQVLSIDADGNKVWANQYAMDGTLTPGYQKETLWHVFVIDITNNTPEIGTYYFTSGNVQIRIVKDGAVIAKTVVNGAKEIQIASIIPSGTRSGVIIWVTTRNNKQKLDCYFEDNSNVVSGDLLANKWYISTIQYSSNEVDNLLKKKLDSPTNAGVAGQVPVYQEDGSTVWGDMPVQIQADWNQNDETAADYVKNRPFYTGDPVETVLVEESTVTFADTGYGFYAAEFPSTFEATVGETYKVSWDGTAYECTCVKFNNKPAIGNLSIAGVGSDTGEPFIIGIFNGERIQIIIADTSASHTFSISTTVAPVIKIDPKYLPIPKMTMVSISAANWTGDTAPYSQVITVNGVTANSKVDLQPTAAQILELQEADIMLMAENDNGTVTIYALGGIPTSDYTMQALITEVEVV